MHVPPPARPLNRVQRRALDRARAARLRERLRARLDPGDDSGLDQVTFWVPLRQSDRAAFQRLLSASLPGVDVDVRFPGLDKQEPPAVGAAEGSTTTTRCNEDRDGRSPQCAR